MNGLLLKKQKGDEREGSRRERERRSRKSKRGTERGKESGRKICCESERDNVEVKVTNNSEKDKERKR